MALQLTGAAKSSSVANLQVRMPIVVIGGGLTAIDTATESLAYYVVQVEKFLERYETLAAEKGANEVTLAMDPGGNRNRRGIYRPCARHSRGASRRGCRGPGSRTDRTPQFLGRSDDRLSPPLDRLARAIR